MEALAFAALAGGATYAARTLATRRTTAAAERVAKVDAVAMRRSHSLAELASVAEHDEPVEHYPVMHLRDSFPEVEARPSPLVARMWPRNQNFVGDGEEVVTTQVLRPHHNAPPHPTRAFLAAGPCETIYWDPATVRAAVVTCGGLCPGLNTVIREVVNALHYTYGVREGNVLGVSNGYRGFYEAPMTVLTPRSVSHIHVEGGTVLGSSRGGFDLQRILESLTANRINMVFVVGGDGTHRGALQLLKGATAAGMKLSVACVPKTIDNDIGLIDKSFGFDTAVEQAVVPLTCAHTEALAAKNGACAAAGAGWRGCVCVGGGGGRARRPRAGGLRLQTSNPQLPPTPYPPPPPPSGSQAWAW